MAKLALINIIKPTPKKWRKLGNALLSVSGTAGSLAYVADNKPMAYALFACAVIGKFICSLTTTDNETDIDNNDAVNNNGIK